MGEFLDNVLLVAMQVLGLGFGGLIIPHAIRGLFGENDPPPAGFVYFGCSVSVALGMMCGKNFNYTSAQIVIGFILAGIVARIINRIAAR